MERGMEMITGLLEAGGMHVLPVHAEVEGGIRQQYFVQLLEKALTMDYTIIPLEGINKILPRKELSVRKYQISMLPGRAAPCAC